MKAAKYLRSLRQILFLENLFIAVGKAGFFFIYWDIKERLKGTAKFSSNAYYIFVSRADVVAP